MAEEKQSFLTKLFQSGVTAFITTIAAALATYYVTSSFKEKEQQDANHEKDMVRVEASAETNLRILKYENRIDSILRENARLKMQLNIGNNTGSTVLSGLKLNAVSTKMADGTWVSGDGAEIWTFNNGSVSITAASGYKGAIESAGTYEASGGKVNGRLHLTRFLYLPVDSYANFDVSIGSDGRSLIGTSTMDNRTWAIALYRQE